MADGTRITGLREAVRDLERLGVEVQDLKDAFGEISEEVAQEAHGLVAIQTGALDQTIRPARTKNKAVVRAGNTGAVPYAPVINYGRDGLGGSEFLTGPANSNPEAKVRAIEQNLDRLIVKYHLN